MMVDKAVIERTRAEREAQGKPLGLTDELAIARIARSLFKPERASAGKPAKS